MSFLEMQTVNKSFGGKRVLKDITFGIAKGEFLAIVGPSGSGKSTLLRVIDGLEKPDSGKIFLDGESTTTNPAKTRRRIGLIFQNPAIFNATTFDNVAYSLRFRGISGEDVTEMTDCMLKALGLYDLRERNALTLSGGEAQRVALARALVYDPDLLLLDEPTVNLDPYNISIIEESLVTRNREAGTTIILVTHNIFQPKRIAGKTALLLEGDLVELVDTKSFFERPRDPRVASFVRGEMIY
jgi:tungstate transport system ATP-binding protein